MKKGLLGLVVIALTIVGCQNYDDQFDDLNKKIATLQTSVNDLDGIQTTIANIMTEIENLKASTASAAELTKVMTEVAALTTSMDEIKAATDYGQDEVDDLETEVDEIKAALNELLEQAAVINQDVVIMSEAQLEYVESLMALDKEADNTVTEDTRVYIVSGNITVDAEFATTAALATRLNNVLNRVSSVITPDGGTGVTVDSGSSATAGADLSMTSMEFVQGTVTLEGANAIDVSNLAALTATLTLKQGGALTFSKLNQVGNVRIESGSVTITSIDFTNVSTGGIIETSTASLSSSAIQGAVNLGKLDLPAFVDLSKATSIAAGGAPNGVTISAPLATSVDLIDTTPFAVSGNVSITAKGAITLNAKSITGSLDITSTEGSIALNDLTSAGIITLTASTTIHAAITANASGTTASGSEVHLAALASNAGGLSIAAGAIDLSKLATNASAVTITTATAISLPALTTNAASITAGAVKTFTAEKLATASASTIDIADGAAVTVLNLPATNTLVDFGTLLTLTVMEQSSNIDFSAASSMTTLNYTGKKLYKNAQGQQTNQVTITSDVLTALNVDGFIGSLVVSGTAKLEDLTTAGNIVNVVIHNNTVLDDVTFGHDHISGEFAATLEVHHNPKIETLDLSTVNKVKLVNVSSNASLTALTMAGYSPAAEPGANISVTIGGNALAATYTTAVAGSETTPYSSASLTDATGLLCSVSDFINFYNDQTDRSATNTPTLSINLAKVTNDAATPVTDTLGATLSGDAAAKAGLDGVAGGANVEDDETDGGPIDSISELTAIVDTCS
jgi:prefoldin subunit 5